ncbi:MAG TPA: asparagine synthetase B, partial [Dehalococcoidia bacterium]|nr:asparagine synthetase B [Dehalococcoidia bacterium]
MCGITGLWDRTGTGDASAVIAMRDALSHRGPDDAGVETWPEHGVGLGHTRLAILDLSPMGHQPMYSHDSSLCITYNGEVYNFKEIRRELEQLGYKFRSESDTEVLLQAYQEWGEASACRFRGMFAYAIWDTYRRQMVLFRDRVGIKPLYYYWDGRTFAFASEIKAILALQAVNRE